jgi:deazaflavin-dependent oxidoreductase (nitroreductase family)
MGERTRIWGFRHVATRYLNPFTRLIAGWTPGFGILTHRGRKTGRTYHTPINVFRREGDFIFFLTYGADAEWVKNVFAEGRCVLRTGGRDVALIEPELITDPDRRLAPPVVRSVGRLLRASQFVRMRAA